MFCLLSGTREETPGALKSAGLGGAGAAVEVKNHSSWGHRLDGVI